MINGTQHHKDNLTKIEKFALWLNSHLGTMGFAIFCFILVTIPIFKPNTQTVIFYISSGYLQLIFLPLILMGSNLQQKHAEHVEEAHYKNMLEMLEKIEPTKDIIKKPKKNGRKTN